MWMRTRWSLADSLSHRNEQTQDGLQFQLTVTG
jgi:hypothetical protein